jgi:hypothetical protein
VCDAIKNSVYNVVSGRDTFARTTREIAEYVGWEYEEAGEFRMGICSQNWWSRRFQERTQPQYKSTCGK